MTPSAPDDVSDGPTASGTESSGSGGRDDNSSTPNYAAVDLGDTAPSEYTYVERRAEILEIVKARGHPRAINQTELAERYDVDQSQISRDLDRLEGHVRERVADRDRRAFVVESVIHRAVEDLLADDQPRAAAKTILEWEEWAAGFSDLEALHQRVKRLEARDREDELRY